MWINFLLGWLAAGTSNKRVVKWLEGGFQGGLWYQVCRRWSRSRTTTIKILLEAFLWWIKMPLSLAGGCWGWDHLWVDLHVFEFE